MNQEKLITILGPTATGKSELAIHLAGRLGSSVISGDAFQVYRGMDIGTAKVTKEESRGVTHYLVDCMDPMEPYSAAIFQERARRYITEENQKGRIPIVAGGTGLYIQGLLEGYAFSPKVGGRDKWYSLYKEKGKAGLIAAYRECSQDGPMPADPQRMIRNLELMDSGYGLVEERAPALVYEGPVIGITMDRLALYDRINKRVHQMIENGLREEVRSLLEKGIPEDAQSLKGIGYKEMIPVIHGERTLADAEILIAKNTRHFAKRQLTWYRRMPYIHWVERSEESSAWLKEAEAYIISWIRGE